MARGDVVQSPWHWESTDYMGRKIQWDVFFDNTTRAIVNPGLTGSRDAGCVYASVIIGDPNDPTRVLPVAEGSFNVTRQRLSQQGLSTVENILALNITAGF